ESKDTFKENDSSFCETSDSLLEEFADELTLLAPFPPGNEDFDFKADLRELEMLLNKDATTNFSPESTINPNLEKFTVESSLVCLPPPRDDKNIGFDLPLFGSNEDLIPKDDASISKENVQKESFRIYSNPLFEFNNDFNSSDVNPFFNKTLGDIENDVSNLSDPLHHKFVGEPLTLPSRNDREFEEYLSLMTVLCEISTSQSQGNVHQSLVIESLPVSPIPVENSVPTQEEIDIFLVPDDLIPPGVENDDSEDEVNELPNLDHQDDPSIPRPPPEPPDIKKCFEPEAGILIIKEFKGVSKSHDFMTGILPTLPTLVSDLTFISSFFSFGSEDTIFDPGIVTFLEPVAFSMAVSCSKYCSP
ncbi:hypothetical protein Tco_1478720, partial [Tanacetum coccineum]